MSKQNQSGQAQLTTDDAKAADEAARKPAADEATKKAADDEAAKKAAADSETKRLAAEDKLLVPMSKNGETLRVHASCVAAHQQAGWSVG